jgi:hypothetical protein
MSARSIALILRGETGFYSGASEGAEEKSPITGPDDVRIDGVNKPLEPGRTA